MLNKVSASPPTFLSAHDKHVIHAFISKVPVILKDVQILDTYPTAIRFTYATITKRNKTQTFKTGKHKTLDSLIDALREWGYSQSIPLTDDLKLYRVHGNSKTFELIYNKDGRHEYVIPDTRAEFYTLQDCLLAGDFLSFVVKLGKVTTNYIA